MLSSTITFVFDMFILKPLTLLSSHCSCSIISSSCGVYVHRKISSAKRRWLRYSPSICRSLFSQFCLLKILSSVGMNSLGEIVSPFLTSLLMFIFSRSS